MKYFSWWKFENIVQWATNLKQNENLHDPYDPASLLTSSLKRRGTGSNNKIVAALSELREQDPGATVQITVQRREAERGSTSMLLQLAWTPCHGLLFVVKLLLYIPCSLLIETITSGNSWPGTLWTAFWHFCLILPVQVVQRKWQNNSFLPFSEFWRQIGWTGEALDVSQFKNKQTDK